jgi:hypothetical protein
LRFHPGVRPATLSVMGTKYLPTNKDRKAGQRFLSQQRPLPFFQKPADKQPEDKPPAKKHPKK